MKNHAPEITRAETEEQEEKENIKMTNNIKEGIFSEIVVLSSSFVIYWFADSEHTIPVWEYETANPEEALRYFRMNK